MDSKLKAFIKQLGQDAQRFAILIFLDVENLRQEMRACLKQMNGEEALPYYHAMERASREGHTLLSRPGSPNLYFCIIEHVRECRGIHATDLYLSQRICTIMSAVNEAGSRLIDHPVGDMLRQAKAIDPDLLKAKPLTFLGRRPRVVKLGVNQTPVYSEQAPDADLAQRLDGENWTRLPAEPGLPLRVPKQTPWHLDRGDLDDLDAQTDRTR